MVFVEPQYKQTTATRVEKMYEESAAKLRADLQRVVKVTIRTVSHSSHQSHHHWRSLEMGMTVLSQGLSTFESLRWLWCLVHNLQTLMQCGQGKVGFVSGGWVFFSLSPFGVAALFLNKVGIPFHAIELLLAWIPFSNPCPVQHAPSCLMWYRISSGYLEIVFKAQCHMMPSLAI